MIQRMQGYEDNRQARNGQRETGWHYMAANGLGSEWQVVLDGPVGPGNGIRRAYKG
jgi:hypothetical protein